MARVPRRYYRSQVMSPRDWLTSTLQVGGGLAQAALRAGVGTGGMLLPVVGQSSEWPHSRFAESAGARQADTDHHLSAGLRSWFQGCGAYLIVEDDLASPADPAVEGSVGDTFVVGSDVYHYLDLDDQGLGAAAEFVRGGASGYPTIAFVVSSFERPDPHDPADGKDALDAMANAVVAALVSAYDDEGYVVWLADKDAPGAKPAICERGRSKRTKANSEP